MYWKEGLPFSEMIAEELHDIRRLPTELQQPIWPREKLEEPLQEPLIMPWSKTLPGEYYSKCRS